jgi:hypothetical protein
MLNSTALNCLTVAMYCGVKSTGWPVVVVEVDAQVYVEVWLLEELVVELLVVAVDVEEVDGEVEVEEVFGVEDVEVEEAALDVDEELEWELEDEVEDVECVELVDEDGPPETAMYTAAPATTTTITTTTASTIGAMPEREVCK